MLLPFPVGTAIAPFVTSVSWSAPTKFEGAAYSWGTQYALRSWDVSQLEHWAVRKSLLVDLEEKVLGPAMICWWLDIVPGDTIGSIRSFVRTVQLTTQKASALFISRVATKEMVMNEDNVDRVAAIFVELKWTTGTQDEYNKSWL